METNLLLDKDSFIWNDNSLDRTIVIEDFISSYNQANNNDDHLWNNPEIWEKDFSHFEKYCLNYDDLPQEMKWLSFDNFQGLVQFFTYYKLTPKKSKSLSELNNEFSNPDQLNGMIGIDLQNDQVYSIPSWYEFHRHYFIANPPERKDFCERLTPYYPNLYFNKSSIVPGLNGLHTDYKAIMKTILYHLSALNDEYYPYFRDNKVGGDDACEYLENLYKGKDIEIGASRDKNKLDDLFFSITILKKKEETQNLYCDLHTKFYRYFEFDPPSYEAKGNRLYFHLPVKDFIEDCLIIARIGKHAEN